MAVNITVTGKTQGITQSTNQIAALGNTITATQKKAQAFGNALGRTKVNFSLGSITGDLNQFESSLQSATARVFAFTATTKLIYGVGNAFQRLASDALKVEDSLARIQAITGKSATEIKGFSKEIFKLANDIGVSYFEAADAAEEFSRQGFNLEKTLKATSTALTIARLSNTNAKKAIDGLTAASAAFVRESLEFAEVGDILISLDQKFNTSAAGIIEALTRVGGVASDAGLSFRETASAITALKAETARSESTIGNSLKSIFTSLQNAKIQDLIENVAKVDTKDLEGNFRPVLQVVTELAQKFDDLSDSQQALLKEKIAGKFQASAFSGLIRSLKEGGSFERAEIVSDDAVGDAKRRLDIINKTASTQLTKLDNLITQFSSRIADNLTLPLTKKLADLGSSFFKTLDKIMNVSTGQLFGDPAEAEEKGITIGEAFGNGIKSVIQGPVFALLAIALGKLAKLTAVNLGQGVKSLVGKNPAAVARETQVIETAIKQAIDSGNTSLALRLRTATQIEEKQRIILNLLQQQAAVRPAPAFNGSNYSALLTPAQRAQAYKNASKALGSKASGYDPTGGLINEQIAINKGVGGATSAARPIIKNLAIDGKRGPVVVNTQEKIIRNFAGTGNDAVLNRDMMGYAKGYVPNYALKVTSIPIKGIDRSIKRDKLAIPRDLKPTDLDKHGEPISSLNYSLFPRAKKIAIEDIQSGRKGDGKKFYDYLFKLSQKTGFSISSNDIVNQRFSTRRTGDRAVVLDRDASPWAQLLQQFPQLKQRVRDGYKTSLTFHGKKFPNLKSFRSFINSNQLKLGQGDTIKYLNTSYTGNNKDIVPFKAGGHIPNYASTRISSPKNKKFLSELVSNVKATRESDRDNPFIDIIRQSNIQQYLRLRAVRKIPRRGEELGEGITASFNRLRGDVGIKYFNHKLTRKDIAHEYAASKFLAESPVLPGVGAPKIFGSLRRSVNRRRIGKQVVTDNPLATEVPVAGKFVKKLLERSFASKGITADDLHGNNVFVNKKGANFLKKNIEPLRSAIANPESQLEFLNLFKKSGGKFTIIDAGFIKPSNKESAAQFNKYLAKGYIPNYALPKQFSKPRGKIGQEGYNILSSKKNGVQKLTKLFETLTGKPFPKINFQRIPKKEGAIALATPSERKVQLDPGKIGGNVRDLFSVLAHEIGHVGLGDLSAKFNPKFNKFVRNASRLYDKDSERYGKPLDTLALGFSNKQKYPSVLGSATKEETVVDLMGQLLSNTLRPQVHNSKLVKYLSRVLLKGKSAAGLAEGYVPHFATPVGDAVQREVSALTNLGFGPSAAKQSVRVGTSSRVATKQNPGGVGVYNTLQGQHSLNQAISQHTIGNFALSEEQIVQKRLDKITKLSPQLDSLLKGNASGQKTLDLVKRTISLFQSSTDKAIKATLFKSLEKSFGDLKKVAQPLLGKVNTPPWVAPKFSLSNLAGRKITQPYAFPQPKNAQFSLSSMAAAAPGWKTPPPRRLNYNALPPISAEEIRAGYLARFDKKNNAPFAGKGTIEKQSGILGRSGSFGRDEILALKAQAQQNLEIKRSRQLTGLAFGVPLLGETVNSLIAGKNPGTGSKIASEGISGLGTTALLAASFGKLGGVVGGVITGLKVASVALDEYAGTTEQANKQLDKVQQVSGKRVNDIDQFLSSISGARSLKDSGASVKDILSALKDQERTLVAITDQGLRDRLRVASLDDSSEGNRKLNDIRKEEGLIQSQRVLPAFITKTFRDAIDENYGAREKINNFMGQGTNVLVPNSVTESIASSIVSTLNFDKISPEARQPFLNNEPGASFRVNDILKNQNPEVLNSLSEISEKSSDAAGKINLLVSKLLADRFKQDNNLPVLAQSASINDKFVKSFNSVLSKTVSDKRAENLQLFKNFNFDIDLLSDKFESLADSISDIEKLNFASKLESIQKTGNLELKKADLLDALGGELVTGLIGEELSSNQRADSIRSVKNFQDGSLGLEELVAELAKIQDKTSQELIAQLNKNSQQQIQELRETNSQLETIEAQNQAQLRQRTEALTRNNISRMFSLSPQETRESGGAIARGVGAANYRETRQDLQTRDYLNRTQSLKDRARRSIRDGETSRSRALDVIGGEQAKKNLGIDSASLTSTLGLEGLDSTQSYENRIKEIKDKLNKIKELNPILEKNRGATKDIVDSLTSDIKSTKQKYGGNLNNISGEDKKLFDSNQQDLYTFNKRSEFENYLFNQGSFSSDKKDPFFSDLQKASNTRTREYGKDPNSAVAKLANNNYQALLKPYQDKDERFINDYNIKALGYDPREKRRKDSQGKITSESISLEQELKSLESLRNRAKTRDYLNSKGTLVNSSFQDKYRQDKLDAELPSVNQYISDINSSRKLGGQPVLDSKILDNFILGNKDQSIQSLEGVRSQTSNSYQQDLIDKLINEIKISQATDTLPSKYGEINSEKTLPNTMVDLNKTLSDLANSLTTIQTKNIQQEDIFGPSAEKLTSSLDSLEKTFRLASIDQQISTLRTEETFLPVNQPDKEKAAERKKASDNKILELQRNKDVINSVGAPTAKTQGNLDINSKVTVDLLGIDGFQDGLKEAIVASIQSNLRSYVISLLQEGGVETNFKPAMV